jgi:hypothetical protein
MIYDNWKTSHAYIPFDQIFERNPCVHNYVMSIVSALCNPIIFTFKELERLRIVWMNSRRLSAQLKRTRAAFDNYRINLRFRTLNMHTTTISIIGLGVCVCVQNERWTRIFNCKKFIFQVYILVCNLDDHLYINAKLKTIVPFFRDNFHERRATIPLLIRSSVASYLCHFLPNS